MMRRSRKSYRAKPVQLTLPLRSSLSNSGLCNRDDRELNSSGYDCMRPRNDALDLGSVDLRRRRLAGAAHKLEETFANPPSDPVTLATVVRDACRWSLKTARCVAVVFW